ncbi:lipopolysaccharide biosynthesis protein [Enterovibrio coralii]|uniref:lipopolysaccharide biosynthesis protein n=1 Tax=Enterovibrio coralii TaxID=294935 RepID=UPI001E4D2896|nr:hypothetical protein [Enterovibrio coralii]
MKKMTSALSQTLLYGSSIALMKGISLLMLPFITHYLPQAEFGKLEIVSSIAALGSILVGLGLEDALYRFVGGCQDSKERKTMAARIFTLTVIVGALLIPISWMLAAVLHSYVPGGLTTYQIQLVLLMLALEAVSPFLLLASHAKPRSGFLLCRRWSCTLPSRFNHHLPPDGARHRWCVGSGCDCRDYSRRVSWIPANQRYWAVFLQKHREAISHLQLANHGERFNGVYFKWS